MTIYNEMAEVIQKGDIKRLKQIMRHQGVYDARNFLRLDLDTPLEIAIEASRNSGIVPALKILVEGGFDVNEEVHHEPSFRRGTRPIWSAIRNGNAEVLSFLIKNGAQLNWPVSNPDNTPPPLSAACWLIRRLPNYIDLIDLLIEAGAQVNPNDSPPPLHCLLAAGRDGNGRSPVEAAKLLLSNGASPNLIGTLLTMNGNMGIAGAPLHSYWNSGIEMVETLIAFGADPNVRASNGENVVQFFKRYHHLVQRSGGINPEVAEVDKIVEYLASTIIPRQASAEPSRSSLLAVHPTQMPISPRPTFKPAPISGDPSAAAPSTLISTTNQDTSSESATSPSPQDAPHADANDDPVRDLLRTCDRAPLEGLAWIDQMGDDLRSSPMIMFARFIAMRHLALDNFAVAGVTELDSAREADVLCIMDEESRINASAALTEAAAIEARHPGYLDSLGDPGDRFALRMLDDVCIVNERLQPGKVQQVLGWTKLQYFGGERIKVLPGLQDATDEGMVSVCIRTKIRPAKVARSAVLYSSSRDALHRNYVDTFLTERDVRTTPTIGDANMFCAVRLYEDGEVEFSTAESDDTPAVSTPPESGGESPTSTLQEIPPTKRLERIAASSETNAGSRRAWLAVAVGVVAGVGALGWFLSGSSDDDSRSHQTSSPWPLAERTAVRQEAPTSANTTSGADARVETNPLTGILKQMARDRAITQECANEGLGAKEILTIRRIDLNRDGSPEFEVTGNPGCACIGARRCATWIYQAIAGGYRQILEEVQPEEGIEVLASETNGYADLAIIELSGDEALRELLRFDGRAYQSSGMKPLSASRQSESTGSSLDIGENRADTALGEPDSNPEHATVNTPGDGFLALRSEPSVSAGTRLLKIPHRTELALDMCLAVSPTDRWCRTTFRGQTGWVFERYLSRGPSERRGGLAPQETPRAQSHSESDHRSSSAISASFAAPPPFRWLQIASRATEAEAVELARHYEEKNPGAIRVFKATNGWFGITGGLIDFADKERVDGIVKSSGYPADSFLVGGRNFVEEVPF